MRAIRQVAGVDRRRIEERVMVHPPCFVDVGDTLARRGVVAR
jgi:hypothetical protein